MASDGSIVIDIILDDGSVAKGVANIDKRLGRLDGSGNRAALGIGKIVSALGLVAIASKAINMVTSSLDGAIKRYDILNNFPRVLQLMGFDAAETDKSIKRLSEGIQGLPTTLQDVASVAQRIAVMTGDLDKATETTLALNNAFLASGASGQDASRGLEQYVQMLAKGEVDLQSWRTLQETMGVALNKTAESFGFAGASAQNDFYDALKEGDITFDQFNDRIIELSTQTGGFADIALLASGGIQTSWQNVKTAIVTGVANIIKAIDEAMGGVGSIAGLLDKAKVMIQQFFRTAVENIPVFIEKVKEVKENLEPWLPLIATVAVAIGSLVTAIATANTIIRTVTISVQLLSSAFMTTPLGWVLAGIMLLVGAFVLAYQKVEWFREMVDEAFARILEVVGPIFEKVKESVIKAIETMIDRVKTFLENLREFWRENGEGILTKAKDIFMSIYNFISGIVKDVVGFVGDQLKKFKDFWDENGQAITAIVQGAFEIIWTNIKYVMNMIKGLFEIVWPIISGIVKYAWNFIKLTIGTAIDLVLGIIQTVLKLIQGDWEGAWETIKQTAEKIMGNIIKFFQDVDLVQIGKDIINGLIKGIGSMVTAVQDRIKGVGEAITGTFKKLFNIKSPSKVMEGLGEDVGEGAAIGIANTKEAVKKSITELGGIVKNATITSNKEIKSLNQNHAKEIASLEKNTATDIANIRSNASSKKRELTAAEITRIHKLEESAAKKSVQMVEKLAKDIAKIEKESANERIEITNKFVESKRNSGELTLQGEIYFWNAMYGSMKKGTAEYENAYKNHQSAVKELRTEMESASKEYNERMIAIDKEYADQAKKIQDEYERAYESRLNRLFTFAGIFEEFKENIEISGTDLMLNLESQVDALQEYSDTINELSKRIDDDNLMNELRSMGVKSLGELKALNSLSDTQLGQYADLYRQKFELATEQANKELEPLRKDTNDKLDALKKDTNTKLDDLNKEWQAKIKAIVQGTAKEFDSMQQVGVDAMTGLRDGMDSMSGPLLSKAQSIANAIKATIQSAFQIHSPSRWMRDMIGKNMMLGWIEGIDNQKSALLKKSEQMTEWMRPDISGDGVRNNLQGMRMPTVNVSPFNTSGGGGTVNNSSTSKSYNPTINNYFTRDESAPSEVARKNKQQQQRLAMELGVL